jgi:formylglycine-generating enzyme required for sulfatase activity
MGMKELVLAATIVPGMLAMGAVDNSILDTDTKNMQCIEGGVFSMGDVFDEGLRFATPVHEVTLTDFCLGRYEVTVEEFAAFVRITRYVTTAEKGSYRAASREDDYSARLASRGSWVLDPERGSLWVAEANWRNPQYENGPRHPVTCVSWADAASYCNWLNVMRGLPAAYDVESGHLLDAEGRPTTDVTEVKGYRLPTEAEWEFAARERGKRIRFGNGQDTARANEMNFNADRGEFVFAEKGQYRGATTPVGSFAPNSLGLYDMSGNVWEWCSDYWGRYAAEPISNPYQCRGMMGPRRAARGGPWVGDAGLARTSARLGWVADDRCNNSGFRVARSK